MPRVSFDDVPQVVEDDCLSVASEKAHPSKSLHSALRMVFQLCPAAAAEALQQPQRAYDFEGSFGAVLKLAGAAEVPTNLFHKIAELVSKSRMQFQTALESGKLPSSCLPPCRRGPGTVVDPTLHSAAPFNNNLFRLVGSLSAKRSINLLSMRL